MTRTAIALLACLIMACPSTQSEREPTAPKASQQAPSPPARADGGPTASAAPQATAPAPKPTEPEDIARRNRLDLCAPGPDTVPGDPGDPRTEAEQACLATWGKPCARARAELGDGVFRSFETACASAAGRDQAGIPFCRWDDEHWKRQSPACQKARHKHLHKPKETGGACILKPDVAVWITRTRKGTWVPMAAICLGPWQPPDYTGAPSEATVKVTDPSAVQTDDMTCVELTQFQPTDTPHQPVTHTWLRCWPRPADLDAWTKVRSRTIRTGYTWYKLDKYQAEDDPDGAFHAVSFEAITSLVQKSGRSILCVEHELGRDWLPGRDTAYTPAGDHLGSAPPDTCQRAVREAEGADDGPPEPEE